MRRVSDPAGVVRNAIRACSLPAAGDHAGGAAEAPLTKRFEDLGFDSLAYMEFCIAIFCDTGVELTIEHANALGSPQAVVELLQAQ